jgi:hypothetical protein
MLNQSKLLLNDNTANTKTRNSVALVHKQTMPTVWALLIGKL